MTTVLEAAAEKVCLQPVLEHRQRRGRRTSLDRLQQQEMHDLRQLTDDSSESQAVDHLADLSLRRCGMSATHVNDDAK